jgi:hypothetical protein
MKLFFHQSRLRATIPDDRSYLEVKPAWAAPMSRPEKYLALLDAKDKEIALLENPAQELDVESWLAVQQELRARYITARIESVVGARQEFGATYWSVTSDRGRARLRDAEPAGKRAVALVRPPAPARRGRQPLRDRLGSRDSIRNRGRWWRGFCSSRT